VTVANETSSAIAAVLELDDHGRAVQSPAEGCVTLGISMSTLYGLMKTGKLPFFHIGGRTKIRVSDIARFLELQRDENPGMRQVPWDRKSSAPRRHWPRRPTTSKEASGGS
jgi:excisionase family DNA binding protein